MRQVFDIGIDPGVKYMHIIPMYIMFMEIEFDSIWEKKKKYKQNFQWTMVSIDINNIDDSINRIKMNARDESILLCEHTSARSPLKDTKFETVWKFKPQFPSFLFTFTRLYRVNDIRWPWNDEANLVYLP